jgi:dienelactone hydrolase
MKHFGVAALAAIAMSICQPSRAAPPLEDYGKLPAIEQMRLSPSGDKIAYIAVDQDRRRVIIKKVGGAPIVAVDVGALKARAVIWLGDDHVLIKTSQTLLVDPLIEAVSRGEFSQSSIIDSSTGKVFNVFQNEPKILPTTYGYYGSATQGLKHYAFFGGVTLSDRGTGFSDFATAGGKGYLSHGHTDLYQVDLDTGHSLKVAGGSELHGTGWLVDRVGSVLAHEEYNRGGAWRLYAGPGDGVLIAQADDPIGDIGITGLGRVKGSVLVQGIGRDGDFTFLEYLVQPGAAPTEPFGGRGVREFLRDPETGLLIGGVTNADDPETILFDPVLQTKFDKVRRALPGEVVTLASATGSFDRMILFAHGPGDSGTYFLVDYPTHKIEAIGWEYPTILQGDVAATRTVPYKAADGLDMQGILTLPPGREAKGLPLVVMPHGGPESRDYERFDWWAQAFAARGYAVFQPNFRGSSGFGKAFRDAGDGQWGRKMQTDVSDGMAELVREGVVDPKRACVVGASYGGYVALAGVTVQQGLYRCAVSVGGISDLNALLAEDATRYGERSLAMRSTRLYLGVTGNSSSVLNAISPRRLASKADAPILLIFGRDDTVVSVDQSRDFADALRAAKKPVEVVQLSGEDHWLSRAATRIQMLQASVAFVEKNNPPN